MSRQHPWRADNPDAVIVDRRTRWGNNYVPHRVGGVWQVHYRLPDGSLYPLDRRVYPTRLEATVECVRQYRLALERNADDYGVTISVLLADLTGRDLACWCPLTDGHGNPTPCHADLLLTLSNHAGCYQCDVGPDDECTMGCPSRTS